LNLPEKEKSDSLIKVGISTCLLGERVRFDGGHKRDRYITDILGDYFKFVPVCPELDVGMGVPRESVRLEGEVDSPRMVGTKTGKDWTAKMNRYSCDKTRKLERLQLSGYILKKDSPSCGMERVRVYGKGGVPNRNGRGLYAAALLDRYSLLPVEEEGRLNDARLRENFIVRVFGYHRLQQLIGEPFARGRVVEFHAAHKFLLLAHSPKHYKQLGQLVAAIKQHTPAEFRDQYSLQFMEALQTKTTTKKNVNVLQHILGYLKDKLESWEKQDILAVIKDYHAGLLPLVVPLTLIRHYVDKHKVEYVQNQIYLTPHPKELMLRNHV
jgi:uncharacterized protein YbgA (DUF1722 family)/uncharacterized protein YbbK (DUF523 family)